MYVTFTHPEYLWYLLSVPLLIITHFVLLRYTKRKALKFANFQALKRVVEQKFLTKNYIVLVLRILILFCLIFAVADTAVWYKGMSNQNDFILALDTSASMTAQDIKPNRLDAAKEYAGNFINSLNSESKIGIVSFSGASFIEQLPTNSKSELKSAISAVELAHTGGTDIAGAIVTSTNLLLDSKKGKSIILLTDGSSTTGYFNKDPVDEGIKYANQNNVLIYTIGLGNEGDPIGYLPEYYNISSVYEEDVLIKIANQTGGKYYHVETNQDLKDAYEDILQHKNEAYLSIDLSPGLMILALLLVFLEWGLINTRFRLIP